MLSPTVLGVIICVTAAVLEGALAGTGARQRLAQLRMPPYSPPFALWLVIGFLFYAMCFVILRHVLSTGLVSSSQVFALVLTAVLLPANAFWSVLSTAFTLSMLLDGAIIYGDLTPQTPNQTLEPTRWPLW
jgi:hypothetical protein